MRFTQRLLTASFILIEGLIIAPVSFSAGAPVEDLTQQGGTSYDAAPPPANNYRSSNSRESNSRSSMPTDQRMTVLEQQVRNLTQLDPVGQINRLQSEVDRLRGQVETQEHMIKQLTEQLRAQYQDIDQRLAQSPTKKSIAPAPFAAPSKPKPAAKPQSFNNLDESADIMPASAESDDIPPAPATAKAPKKTAAPAATADEGISDPEAAAANTANQRVASIADPQAEKKIYDSAIALMKKQDYVQATTQLQRYLQDYPGGKYTASSHYWLGKIYSYQGQPDLAITEYNTVINNYPTDPKMPNALLELGIAYDEAGDWEQAKTQLNKVIKLFPKTETAQLANARLQKIKRQGM